MDKKLSGDYIAGFVDGEGCFALKYRRDRQINKVDGKAREYYYWGAEFAIVLHPADFNLLETIKEVIGAGRISHNKKGNQVRLSVQNTKELKNVLIPFFKKYQLYGIKRKDFDLWCKAVKIIFEHKQKTKRGYANPIDKLSQKKLEEIKFKMDLLKHKGKS